MSDNKEKKVRGSIMITGQRSDVDLKKLTSQFGKGHVKFKKAKKIKKKSEPKKPDPVKSEPKKPVYHDPPLKPEPKKPDPVKSEPKKKKGHWYDTII